MDTRTIELDGALSRLYDAVLAPQVLGDALNQCAAWVGADTFHLFSVSAADDAPLLSIASPSSLQAEQQYISYYAAIDPRRQSLDMKAVGELAACQLEFSPRYVSGSEIWQDLLIPSNARYTSGGALQRDDTARTFVGFHRPERRGPYTDSELRRTAALLPHLSRAMRLMGRTADLQKQLGDARGVLDAQTDGAFLLAASGKLLWANAAGTALLNSGLALRVMHGHLQAGRLEQAPLRDAFARVLAGGRPESLRLAGIARGLSAFEAVYITVMRTTAAASAANFSSAADSTKSFASGSSPQTGQGPHHDADLVVLAHQPGASPASARALTQLFGLTQAEAALATALANGATIEEYAHARSLGLPTVRTHVRAIYAKTGVRTLQDLLRLMGGVKTPA